MAKLALALAALLILSASPLFAAPANCTLALGASCSIQGAPPNCCSSGYVCSATSGTCQIPVGSVTSCSANSSCTSGRCDAEGFLRGTCVLLWGCGWGCSASADCGASCPICGTASGGGASTCRSCLPNASTTACTSTSQCCTGFKCNPSTSRCTDAFSVGTACTDDSDCASGQCRNSTSSGTKTCAPSPSSCRTWGMECGSSIGSCCSSVSPPNADAGLFCDTLNPAPGSPSGSGVCKNCVSDGQSCNATTPCCGSGYSCRAAAWLGAGSFCLNSTSGGASTVFNNWLKVGNGTFAAETSTIHSGSAALRISGQATSYLYHSNVVLKNSTYYRLSFWAASTGSTTGVRYAVYDIVNNAYLNSAGGWTFVPVNASGYASPLIHNTSITSGTYSPFTLNFTTLPRDVGPVQLRLYPPDAGTGYVDDFEIGEVNDFSILALVKPQSNGTLFYQLLNSSGIVQGMHWRFADRILQIRFYSNSTGSFLESNSTLNLSDAQWHHVAVTVRRGGNMTSYLDGSPVSSVQFLPTFMNSTQSFYIGSQGGSSSYFAGYIDELRIYKRELPAAEVLQQYYGIYRGACSFSFDVYYNGSNFNSTEIYSAMNAQVRVRSLDPDTALSMPFDAKVDREDVPAVPDYSPYLTHGTMTNATWTSGGRTGGAYIFNATRSSRIKINVPVISGPADYTLMGWAYPYNVSGSHYLFGNRGTGSPNGLKVGINSSSIYAYVYGITLASNTTVGANLWSHIALVKQGGYGTLYINGVAAGTGTFTGAVPSRANFSIGNGPDYTTEGFNGLIDEVRAYRRPFSAEEIRAAYRDSYKLSDRLAYTSEK